MLLSMTGFGKAEGTVGNTEISVELRSVNSRYLEIYVAAPKYLNFLEDTCRKSIRERISRGNIHCLVNLGNGSNTLAGYTVNLPLLNNFVEIMHKIADETGVKPRLSMQDLLSQPELLSLEESSIDPEVLSDRVREILERAAGALLEMEKIEGKYIRKLFTERLRSMEDRLNRVVTVQRANVSAHIAQMKERVRSLLEDEPGELSFRQEVVQLADKLDVSEEVDRFRSHITQFRSYLDLRESVGKRLNFLLQEMNREVTTMGNKASSSEISQHVVEIKNEIETVREQVQNIQ